MHDHKEMSEEQEGKLMAALIELGIDQNMIDERLMWSYEKAPMGLVRLRLMLDEMGIDAARSKEIIDDVVDKAMSRDLAKVREWQERRKAEKISQ